MKTGRIPGNHETDSAALYDNTFGSALADRNLHGRVINIAGCKVAGLGGVFPEQVWMAPDEPQYHSLEHYLAHCGKGNHWRGGLPLRQRSTIFPSDYARLKGQAADVLVTHEAPSCHPHGHRVIDDLARYLGVQQVFHGHHHDHLYSATSYVALGYRTAGTGLRGIMNLQGKCICGGDA